MSNSVEEKNLVEGNTPAVLCLTPTRNEAWILDRFLPCASQWADQIVMLDQCSDDGSAELARSFPKVALEQYTSREYDDKQRRAYLTELARRVPGPRLLLSVDADEFLIGNAKETKEWEKLLETAPGTMIEIERISFFPGAKECWSEGFFDFGFMDDGSPIESTIIHGPRIPTPKDAPRLRLTEIKMLHYQYMDWARMESKQRWYQCWETVHNSQKRPITLFRQYHHMYAIPEESKMAVQDSWIAGYEDMGLDMHHVPSQETYYWDPIVLDFFAEYGTAKFRKLDIWGVDWAEISQKLGRPTDPSLLRDPRNGFERQIHKWLMATQSKSLNPEIRWVQRFLRLAGW